MRPIRLCVLCAFLLLAAAGIGRGQVLRHVESNPATGSSAAVLVDDVPLVHTPQLLPVDEAGSIVAPGDAAAQLEFLLDRLEAKLNEVGSNLDRLAKLNLYVVNEQAAKHVWPVLAKRFATESRPAVSLVVTPLPQVEALLALDAVAAANFSTMRGEKRDGSRVLPAGSRIYISGQAEPGSLREATRKTLESLSATLKHCGRPDADIVQVKCFLTPMSSVAEVQDEIVRYYGGDKLNTPPLVFVEWKSSSPIEIELIAWGGEANADAVEPLEFLPAPGLKPSPLFSRVARVHRGRTIFLGDMYGSGEANAATQVQTSFERLKLLLEKTGSDLKNLAKATYYVADDEISKAHNETRPKYYDPERPPAASKAMVGATGRPGVRYVMDMIAVPSSLGTPASKPEVGYMFRADDAADGWINLFDGETTLGWKGARVENGSLFGGERVATLPRCAMRMELVKPGAEQVDFTVGGKTVSIKSGMAFIVEDLPGGTLKIDADVAIKSLDIRPLGLKPLWNGRDLTGWQPIGRQGVAQSAEPYFRVEGHALRVAGGPAALEYTGEKFGDMVVQIDVRTRAVHSNGGLFLRAIPGQFMNGYEAQLHNRCLDNDPARTFKYATGGLDDRQDARRLVSRDFETFRMTVIASGPHLATWVNGRQVTSWTDDREPHENPRQGVRLEAGAIQIQAHDPATDYEVLQILAAGLKPKE